MNRPARALASQPGLLGARIGGAALQAAILILLARLTSLADFGAFGVSLAVGAIALGIGGLGLSTRALRAGHRDEQGIGRTSLILAAVGAGIAGGIAIAVGVVMTGSVAPAVAAGAFMFADGVAEVAQNLMFGTHRLSRAAAITVCRRIGPLTAIGAAALWFPSSAAIYWAAALGATLGLVFVMGIVRLETVTERSGAAGLIRESRPYWVNGAWAMVQQLDLVIIGTLLGPRAAGVFTAGFRLASPAHIITSLIVAQMVPSMTAALTRSPSSDGGRAHLRLAMAYGAAIAALSPALAWAAILLLGPDFSDFWIIFVILFANTAVSVVNQTLTARVFALNRHQGVMPWLTATSTLVGLSIVVAGALAQSLVVAALGTLAIQLTLLVTSGVVERRSVREVVR